MEKNAEESAQSARKLNLGCGNKKIEGFINVDSRPDCKPDVLVDLDKGLGAFDNDSIDEIRVEHVLEHVNDLLLVLSEMYRVSRNGAVWNIFVPHYSHGFVHPFHKRGFCCCTFDWFFNKASPENYGNLDLTVQKVQLNYIRSPSGMLRVIAFPVNFFANVHKRLCERLWCYWVGGFEEIHYTIRANKSPGFCETLARGHK
jgi:hypothetical protein